MPEIYSLKNIGYFRGKNKVLDVEHLSFLRNRIYFILGPNGAGKTTLLKILNGLNRDYIGRMEFMGEDAAVSGFSLIRKKTVYLHQNPVLFRGSVSNNIAYGLKLRKADKIEIRKKIKETLSILSSEDLSRRKARELSGGEKKKVAIARALALDPEILLLDEPTSNLDADSVKRLREVIINLKEKSGKTVIFASHDVTFGKDISDYILFMRYGKIEEQDENYYNLRIV